MRDEDLVAGALEGWFDAVQGSVELDGSDHREGFAGGKVPLESGEQVHGVDADVDEDVESGDVSHGDGDEAAVGVVHEQVAAEGAGGVIVDAAGAVGDVAHDEGFGAGAEASDDVGDGGGEEEETFGELQGDSLGARAADAVDGFGELEGVVGGQEGDGGGYVGVVKDGGGNLVESSGCASGLRDWGE